MHEVFKKINPVSKIKNNYEFDNYTNIKYNGIKVQIAKKE